MRLILMLMLAGCAQPLEGAISTDERCPDADPACVAGVEAGYYGGRADCELGLDRRPERVSPCGRVSREYTDGYAMGWQAAGC